MNRITLAIATAIVTLLTGYGAAVATETSAERSQGTATIGASALASANPAAAEPVTVDGPAQAGLRLDAEDLESLVGATVGSATATSTAGQDNGAKREHVRLEAKDLESLL